MRKIALMLACTALSACNFAPKHVRPALPTALEYPPEVTPGGGARNAASVAWQEFFQDERLRELIETALENNRDLRVATARIAEARGQFRIQDAERLPQLGLNGSATRTRAGIASINPIQGGAAGGGGGLGGGGISGFEFNNYDVSVGVTSFEVDFWGRVRNLSEAARAQYLSTLEAERAFRLSLIRDLSTAYLTSRSLAEQIALGERTIASRRVGLRIAKLRLDAGVTSALDYRQSETLLTQAETEVASLRNQRAQARNLVRLLVGAPIVEEQLADARPLARQGIVGDIAAGLPSELLINRPDVLAAEDQLRAARANIGAARAAFFPTISLTGSLGFASTQLDNLVGNDGLAWSFGPALRLPIFDAGALRGNLDVARARESIAVSTYEQTVQTAFREVADALAGRRYLAEQVEAQARALEAQRRLSALARLRYDNGVAQYIEVLDAERNLFAAEQAMIALRGTELQNLVTLYVALGGGLAPPSGPVAAPAG